jgi:ATP-dependent Clp protease ATP-binding subunit ClpB
MRILDLRLKEMQDRLSDRNITLEIDEARNYLATRGYSPVYGARPLNRAIQVGLAESLVSHAPRRACSGWRSHSCWL